MKRVDGLQKTEEDAGGWVLHHEPPWWRKIVVAVVVLFLVGGLTYYWKGAALRKFGNEWSAERHLAKAESALSEGDATVALRRALISNDLDRGRISTLRVLFECSRIARDERMLVFAGALFDHPEATPPDRLQAVSAFLDGGDLVGFHKLFGHLTDEEMASRTAMLLSIQSLLLRNQPGAVVRSFEEGKFPNDPEFSLLHATSRLRLSGDALDGKAIEMIETILNQAEDQQIIERCLALVNSIPPGILEVEMAARLRAVVENLSQPAVKSYPLLMASLTIAENPKARDALVRKLVSELSQSHTDALCLWLLGLEEHALIIEILEDEFALRSPVAYRAKVSALIAEDRLVEAESLLRFPPTRASLVETEALRAVVARRLGWSSEATSAWRSAMIEAERDFTVNHFLSIARIARWAGVEEVAIDALVAACRNPRGILPPSSEVNWVIARLFEGDRPEQLLALTRRLLLSEWDNPILLNNAVYLSIIVGGQIDEAAVQLMEDMVAQNPDSLPVRNTLALAYLASGFTEKARGVYQSNEWEGEAWRDLSPVGRTVLALTFALSGEIERSEEISDAIEWDSLLARERAYFRDSMRAAIAMTESE